MRKFHCNHGEDVKLSADGRVAERVSDGEIFTTLVSEKPLEQGHVWSVEYHGVEVCKATIGVAWCNPSSLTALPHAEQIPRSAVLSGEELFLKGRSSGTCPPLSVTSGQTFGVSWTPGKVTFHREKQVHYEWEAELPDKPQAWGVLQMWSMDKVSLSTPEIVAERLYSAVQCTFKSSALNELHCSQSDGSGLRFDVVDSSILPPHPDSTFISDCVKVSSNAGTKHKLKEAGVIVLPHICLASVEEGENQVLCLVDDVWKVVEDGSSWGDCVANIKLPDVIDQLTFVIVQTVKRDTYVISGKDSLCVSSMDPDVQIQVDTKSFKREGTLTIKVEKLDKVMKDLENLKVKRMSPMVQTESSATSVANLTLPLYQTTDNKEKPPEKENVAVLSSARSGHWDTAGNVTEISRNGLAKVKIGIQRERRSYLAVESECKVDARQLREIATQVEDTLEWTDATFIVKQHRNDPHNAMIKCARADRYREDCQLLQDAGFSEGPAVESVIRLRMRDHGRIHIRFSPDGHVDFQGGGGKTLVFNAKLGSNACNCILAARGDHKGATLHRGLLLADVQSGGSPHNTGDISVVVTLPKTQTVPSAPKVKDGKTEAQKLRDFVSQLSDSEHVKAKWRLIGGRIGLTSMTLANIEINHQNRADKVIAMVEEFVALGEKVGTRESLARVLKLEGLNSLAESLMSL